MKIMIASDTHQRDGELLECIREEEPLDMFIHLGDFEGNDSVKRIRNTVLPPCSTFFVSGNNDYFMDLPKELVVQIGPYRVFLTHGHRYGVGMGIDFLCEEAKLRQCDIVMYGHTHIPCMENRNGVLALNPGSISYPRQANRRKSYLIMEIDNKTGKLDVYHKYL